MRRVKRSEPKGPASVRGRAAQAAPRERVFGGPAPEGPLPGRILVQLSRLHRAETVSADAVKDRQDA